MDETGGDIVAIVPGGSNTDLVVSGAGRAGPGELAVGGRFTIGPGGKSRNVAQMMAALLGRGRVAFLGRTLACPPAFAELDALLAGRSEPADPADVLPYAYALLARVPLVALRQAGVVCDFVREEPFGGTASGVAEILVSDDGENTIYLTPGVNADFSPDDVEAARELFDAVAARAPNDGAIMPLALEFPLATAVRAAQMAHERRMTVVLDPGGLAADRHRLTVEAHEVLRLADILKPNEHEARMLSGIEVVDTPSAEDAAREIAEGWEIHEIVITAGRLGAWHWADGAITHYPAYDADEETVDTTGCGDQFTAALSAHLAGNPDGVAEGIRRAVVAAALEATKPGIQPVADEEIDAHLARYTPQA